jgi:hypothetical protein
VSAVKQQKAPVNPAPEREYLLHALRTAAARARLVTNVLDTVGVSLRHKAIATDEAMRWLADEDVLVHVHFGPPAKTDGGCAMRQLIGADLERFSNGDLDRLIADKDSIRLYADDDLPDLAKAFTFLGDAPVAPPRELVKKLLPAYGVVIQGGQSSAGKTFLESINRFVSQPRCHSSTIRSLKEWGRLLSPQRGRR